MSYGDFLRGLLKDPRAVSAPTPSGPVLSAAMAEKVDPLRPGLVVELGAGTGVVTEALIARGIAPERLLIIEYGAFFVQLLKARFPGATVVQGDAFSFERYLPEGAKISAVVCGVPLLNFPLAQRQALIERALAAQEEGGRFVQLSYGWKPPIAPGKLKLSRTVVWRNLPPAHVWTYRALPQEMPAREAPASGSRATSQ
jgi:phosphatidylethanolamine/phosphatidyl-N-methylethanolamine N-methyltransferase